MRFILGVIAGIAVMVICTFFQSMLLPAKAVSVLVGAIAGSVAGYVAQRKGWLAGFLICLPLFIFALAFLILGSYNNSQSGHHGVLWEGFKSMVPSYSLIFLATSIGGLIGEKIYARTRK